MRKMIIVVGGKNDNFFFMGENKTKFFCNDDPDNFYYNEMCGYKFALDNFEKLKDEPYIGLEHYRRAFDCTDKEIREILESFDVIVKNEHGPYGKETNLSVLASCSRYGISYVEQAKRWVWMFPELREQAERRKHWGCNMLVAKPQKFKEMLEDEFGYIEQMMKAPNLQRGAISYFCETILTPYIVRKHCRKILIGKVKMP